MNSSQCACHSLKPFAKCCQPFLNGETQARTVTQLMRSRYSAFALGAHGDYLYRTWHPASRGTLQPLDLDVSAVTWIHLKVVQAQQSGNTGSVEFIAHFTQEDESPGVHHEFSTFVREKGRWLYHQGREIEDS